jgi:hypothetical protein
MDWNWGAVPTFRFSSLPRAVPAPDKRLSTYLGAPYRPLTSWPKLASVCGISFGKDFMKCPMDGRLWEGPRRQQEPLPFPPNFVALSHGLYIIPLTCLNIFKHTLTCRRCILPEAELPLTEAARFLGVSRAKMWALVKKNVIAFRKDPLDDRKKLFKESDLRKLKEPSA